MIPVYVPHPTDRELEPWVRRVLDSYRNDNVDIIYVGLGEDDSYRRLLNVIWRLAQTVVIVEHDIIPWPGAIEELYHCMGRWCSCAYRYRGGYGIYHGFGCTKISGELMRAVPGVWDEPGHWSTLDQRLYFAARDVAGQEPHPHRPPVIHLNPKEYTA